MIVVVFILARRVREPLIRYIRPYSRALPFLGESTKCLLKLCFRAKELRALVRDFDTKHSKLEEPLLTYVMLRSLAGIKSRAEAWLVRIAV